MKLTGLVVDIIIKDKTPICVLMVGMLRRIEVIIPMAVFDKLRNEEHQNVSMHVDHVIDDRYMLKFMVFDNPNPVDFDESNPNNQDEKQ